MPSKIPEFRKAVVDWFAANARDLPWRETSDPYKIWVSEMMLQQTQVSTVIPYYKKFLAKFPNVRSLASASELEVLKLWEGLGYYRRAKNMRLAARMIVEKFDGKFPATREELLSVPGIGPYSAGAILSIAFRKSTPALDGNLIRVYSRVYALRDLVNETSTLKKLWALALEHCPPDANASREFTEGMMELGALICTPKNPNCDLCPLARLCEAKKLNLVAELPRKAAERLREKYYEVVSIVRKGDKLGLLPKGSDPKFPDFMRLPFRLVRKPTKKEIALRKFKYSVTHRDFEVFVETKRAGASNKFVWVSSRELDEILLPAIDRKIVRANLA